VPTYEYRCNGCDATVERWQRFDEAPLTICPSCGGELRKLFFPASIVFKGSGWYCTDSRSKGKSESESSATTSTSTSTKTESTKPEPAATTAS